MTPSLTDLRALARAAKSSQRVARIVGAIIDDLADRKGLRHEWDQIDPKIQREIRKRWAEIIAARTDVPALCDAVLALAERLEKTTTAVKSFVAGEYDCCRTGCASWKADQDCDCGYVELCDLLAKEQPR